MTDNVEKNTSLDVTEAEPRTQEEAIQSAAFSTIQDTPANGLDDVNRFGDFDPDMSSLEILTQGLDPEVKAGVRVAMALMAEDLTEQVSENSRYDHGKRRWIRAGNSIRQNFHGQRAQSRWNR